MKEIYDDGHEADKRRHGWLTINDGCRGLRRRVTGKNLAMEIPCYSTCRRLWGRRLPFSVEFGTNFDFSATKIWFLFECLGFIGVFSVGLLWREADVINWVGLHFAFEV